MDKVAFLYLQAAYFPATRYIYYPCCEDDPQYGGAPFVELRHVCLRRFFDYLHDAVSQHHGILYDSFVPTVAVRYAIAIDHAVAIHGIASLPFACQCAIFHQDQYAVFLLLALGVYFAGTAHSVVVSVAHR